jgi:hypothetical protein
MLRRLKIWQYELDLTSPKHKQWKKCVTLQYEKIPSGFVFLLFLFL